MTDKTIILAFSGGLDTSYCVLSLREAGYRVVTYYVHTGSEDVHAQTNIETRAHELGASEHHTIDASADLWDAIVLPYLAGGARRQGRYPVLCADRYLIAKYGVDLAEKTGATAIAHGCTGMGNDQVRFDVSFASLSDLPVIAPIRDIQDKENVREYEIAYLEQHGFSVPSRASRFSVNENMLGATLSGGPIDEWQTPEADARVLTNLPQDAPRTALTIKITFAQGVPTHINGEAVAGADMLGQLNTLCGPYGVGYDVYTGDTLVGLKGRIVFEAPGLTALETAHTALYECTASMAQNGHRRSVGDMWVNLVYDGRYFDPLREDLEAYLASTQKRATGEVTLQVSAGVLVAVAVDSAFIVKDKDSVYAQKAAWSGKTAEGFTALYGQPIKLWRKSGVPDA